MAVEYRSKRDINQGFILLFGLLFLAGAILTYYFILKGIFGRITVDDLIPDSKSVHTALFEEKPKAAILYSKYTENMLPSGNTWLNDNISTWKRFLNNSNIKYDIISDSDIELGKLSNYNLLILPGSKSLSDKEIIEIKKYTEKGGSLFATTGIASYTNDGKWRGWDFFSELFGVKFSKEIKSDELTAVHTLRGNLPLTANIPTGYPLQVAVWDRPMAVEVLESRTTQVSFWYNYKTDGGLVREGIRKSAGIISGNYGTGRFVWMGFELNSVIGVQEDYIFFERLFKNSVSWLTYNPAAYIKEWPLDYQAAAVIIPVLSNEINNVKDFLSLLKNEKINATFFIEPAYVKLNQNLLKNISDFGEIGLTADIGYLSSVNDTINKLNDYLTQLWKLQDGKRELESITNKKVTGFLPYFGLYDNNTVHALIASDFNYIITDSLTDRSVPKTLRRDKHEIISLTRTARDDYQVIRDYGLTENEFQFYTYQEDIDRVLFEGGLYLLKLHSDYQLKSENLGVIKRLIKDLKEKKFWIATAEEISEWYRKKDIVELLVEKRGNKRVALTVSNPGNFKINHVSVDVDLNEPAEKIELSTEIIGTKKAKMIHKKGSKFVSIFIEELNANESRTYYIDYDKPNT